VPAKEKDKKEEIQEEAKPKETPVEFLASLASVLVTGLFIITIKVNKIEISDIIATLQRYEYSIRYYFGEEDYENELRKNYDLLMTYLKI